MDEFSRNKCGGGSKLLFLVLSTLSLLLLMLITTLLWWFISPRLHEISYYLATTILVVLRIFYFVIILGIVMLFMECYSRYSIKKFHEIIRFSIKLMFPVNILLGKFFCIEKDRIRESFVEVNNSFIKFDKHRFSAQDVLVLLPHCLQNYDCIHRVTNNIDVCHDCGKCTIQNFKKIKNDLKVNVAIATGGTLARKIIVQTKPKCIVAVACQRDLVDGLLDVFPIPVYGILNETPSGPCINTSVNIEKIEEFLRKYVRSP